MMVPYHMILIPVYVNVAQLGWLNTFLGLTVPFLYQGLYIFMLRQFFISVPNEFLEAARIDGLTKMGAFWRIVYPLARSSLITMSILAFSGTWNSYLIPSTLANTPEMYVLVVGLNSVKDMFFENTPLIMAGLCCPRCRSFCSSSCSSVSILKGSPAQGSKADIHLDSRNLFRQTDVHRYSADGRILVPGWRNTE